MAEPKTFEEFEEYVKKKSYLYPITSELLSWGKEEDTPEFQYHRENIQKLWERYKRPPAVECIIGFAHYMIKTAEAVDQYSQSNPALMGEYDFSKKVGYAYTPLYNTLSDVHSVTFLEEDQKRAETYLAGLQVSSSYKNKLRFDFNKNSFLLKKSIVPGKGCKMFAEAIADGKRVYASKGPAIHKWKKDEKGCIMREDDGKGDFMMDLSDELIFWSIICAPFKDIYHEIFHGGPIDFRFIADTEVLDVAECYKKKLEDILTKEGGKAHRKEKKYKDMLKGKLPIPPYNLYLDEILDVRKHLDVKEDEAVFYITVGRPWGSIEKEWFVRPFGNDVVLDFQYFHDIMKVVSSKDRIYNIVSFRPINRFKAALKMSAALEIQHDEFSRLGKDRLLSILNENKCLSEEEIDVMVKNVKNRFAEVTSEKSIQDIMFYNIFSINTHDKIPHSYVGSVFKNGEVSLIKKILKKEKTKKGFRGFEIRCPHVVSEYLVAKNYSKLDDVIDKIEREEKKLMKRFRPLFRMMGKPNSDSDIKLCLSSCEGQLRELYLRCDGNAEKAVTTYIDSRGKSTSFGVNLKSILNKLQEDKDA